MRVMCFLFCSTHARRSAAVLFLGVALTGLTGCYEEAYPPEMNYPLRSDRIVTEPLITEPTTTDRPGEYGQLLNLYLQPSEQRKLFDPNGLSTSQRSVLEKALNDVFGTPANPTVGEISETTAALLQLDDDALKRGSGLYRQHCLHCHGLTGDGRGPTSPWVNPHPRDYRNGAFKFTSSTAQLGDRRARRYDLLRLLREGIEDTSMPSFRLLADQELESLASYVIHLSLRGQVEQYVIKKLRQEEVDIDEQVRSMTGTFADKWETTEKNVIQPGPYVPLSRASVERGQRLFLLKDDPKAAGGTTGGCASCHLDFGRAATYRFDEWGTIVRPADLTRGNYRGGRRPIDLYWRVHSGINGVGMPATNLQPEQIWDVVNFLQVLPYPDKHAQYGVNIDTTMASASGR